MEFITNCSTDEQRSRLKRFSSGVMTNTNTVKCLVVTLFKGTVAHRVADCIGEPGCRYVVLPIKDFFPNSNSSDVMKLWASERLLPIADHADYEYYFAKVIDADNFDGKRWTGLPYQDFATEPGNPDADLIKR